MTTVLTPNFTVGATSNYGWETTYCGYRWDVASGLFIVRNRILAAAVGTWCQRDPLGNVESLSLYEYVGNKCTRFTDPLGLQEGQVALIQHLEARRKKCARDQKRLDEIHCIMKWLVVIGDYWSRVPCPRCLNRKFPELNLSDDFSPHRTSPFSDTSFPGAKRAMIRSWEKYPTVGWFGVDIGIPVTSATLGPLSDLLYGQAPSFEVPTGQNFPVVPGFVIPDDQFYGDDIGTIGTLAHEAMHTLGSPGTLSGFGGHSGGEHIGGMPPGVTVEGAVSDLLNWTKGFQNSARTNLFQKIKEACRMGSLPKNVPSGREVRPLPMPPRQRFVSPTSGVEVIPVGCGSPETLPPPRGPRVFD